MRVNILPSPSPSIALRQYREEDRADFRFLSDALPKNSLPPQAADDPGEYSTAVIFENGSDKEITGLRYCWSIRASNGEITTHIVASDSYQIDGHHPVALPQSKQVFSVSGRLDVDQSLYDYVRAGGRVIVGRGSAGKPLSDAEEITFQIELVVFADGEIAGPDPGHYAAELQGRKKAAEYVAKQLRLAKLEERDPTPVLVALRDMPRLGSDRSAYLVCGYARTYLEQSAMPGGSVEWKEDALKNLETRPDLPGFYRIDNLEPTPSA